MLEIYLKEGFEVSPREGFTGGITDKERANHLLSRKSIIELFARQQVKGWDFIGNELDSRDIRDVLKEYVVYNKNKNYRSAA